jgi:virginiamycin B lyase
VIVFVALFGSSLLWGSAPAFATTCNKFAAEPSKGGSDSNTGEEAHPYATLKKLASSLSAGQTGCVFSGQTIDVKEPQTLKNETHGTEAKPITITSTNSSNPATITSWVALEAGSDWLTFTHLNFKWSMPKPWLCWNAEGNAIECPGEPENAEDHVQISVDAHHDSFTYDEIENEDTDICVNLSKWEGSTAEHTLLEHDRIHNCGAPFTGEKKVVNEEPAWHDHAIYDYGIGTEIFNNYIYHNSRNGILFYGGGNGGVAEHNIIDENGNGIDFGNTINDTVQWNIITNSSLDSLGKCAPTGCDDFAASAGGTSGGIFKHNCTYGNLSGEIEYFTEEPAELEGVTVAENKLKTNPLYKNAATHEYTLAQGSSCLGYGPDTAQPAPVATTEAASGIQSNEATLNGTVNPESLESKYYFEYGVEKGKYESKTAEASAGSGTSNVKESKTITGLTSGKTYYFRIVATNGDGTTDGEEKTFIAEDAPENTALPVASPTTPDQAVPESATTGTWTNSPTSYAYQWERCNATGGECTNISGATKSTYTPVEVDLEHTLVVKVTAKNEAGSTSASSAATGKVKPIGQITEYALPSGSLPIGITVGSDDNLWFTDNGTGKVGKITTSGTITEYSLPTGSEPGGIVGGPDKNLWFAESGTKIGKITTSGTVTEYSLPSGSEPYEIAVGSDKNLWFTDHGTNKIGKITTSGTITEYALPAGSNPNGIAAGPDKNLWFANEGTGKIGKITTSGTVTEYSLPAGSNPAGIVAGSDGNLWFTDNGTSKVGKITTSGTVTEYSLPSGSDPYGIAAGSDGNLWYADTGTSKVGKVTTSGTVTEYSLPAGSNPNRIAVGPDDNLWFTDKGTNKIGKITA